MHPISFSIATARTVTRHATICAIAALGWAGSAQAATYTYSGDTTNAPTYNRAFEDFSGLSILGDAVNYQSLAFTVTATGSYNFVSTADGWDNFLFLYAPSFNPAAATVNGLIANDDLVDIGSSGFSWTLTAGNSYVLVTTGFETGFDFGRYTNTISGAGNVTAVPEPASYALMALGVLGVAAAVRRRDATA